MTYGMLHNYETGEPIRPATLEELEQSVRAARVDGGCGVFELDGVRHFVTGEEMSGRELETLIRNTYTLPDRVAA